MGSKKKNQNETDSEAPPQLCKNGCGFFGTESTRNLCSKCYREYFCVEQQSNFEKLMMEEINPDQQNLTCPDDDDDDDSLAIWSSTLTQILVPNSSSSSSSSSCLIPRVTGANNSSSTEICVNNNNNVNSSSGSITARNRCSSCRKRVGLLGFKCRCGNTFCSMHRYPEEHSCTIDFKTAARDAIAKANPRVKADKLERI